MARGSVNKVILIGSLGKDRETKSFPNGGSLTQFSIATSESWVDKNTGERKEQTEWHRVTAWGKTAEIIEKYVTKGREIGIEGKLTHRSYDDKNGEKRYVTEIVANEVLLLGK